MAKRVFLYLGLSFFLVGCLRAPELVEVPSPQSLEEIERGRDLALGLAACGFCHGSKSDPRAPLIGGQKLSDSQGEITVPNITPKAIGDWSLSQIVEAIKNSTRANGESFSSNFHRAYEWLSNEDALAIAAYLSVLPAQGEVISPRDTGIIQRYTKGLFDAPLVRADGYVPPQKAEASKVYGRYLVDHVARCGFCHSGSDTLFEEGNYLQGRVGVPTLRSKDPGTANNWSKQELAAFMLSGVTTKERIVGRDRCPVAYFANASDLEIAAIAKFITSLPDS